MSAGSDITPALCAPHSMLKGCACHAVMLADARKSSLHPPPLPHSGIRHGEEHPPPPRGLANSFKHLMMEKAQRDSCFTKFCKDKNLKLDFSGLPSREWDV